MTATHNPIHNDRIVFSKSYADARKKFMSLAMPIAAQINSEYLPLKKGIDGESLFCDITYLNRTESRKCLIISSGTHGVEGYCGSALQCELLEQQIFKPFLNDFNIIFVHAINPFGFSYSCRTNEDNIDLNRNFIDFEIPSPLDEKYEKFRAEVFPSNWARCSLDQINRNIERYVGEHGAQQFQALMTKGQYQHPNDTYYGGNQPTWSRQIWEKFCRQTASENDLVVHIDIHSGLGPSGEAEIIFGGTQKDHNIRKAKDWFGEDAVKIPAQAGSLSPEVSGPLTSAIDTYTDHAVSIALEFGTVPIQTMLMRLIADNWQIQQTNCPAHQLKRIKQEMREAFLVEDLEWQSSVWQITRHRCLQAATGLRDWRL